MSESREPGYELTGRCALVTGGARRLGARLALGLAGAGMDVVVHHGHSAGEAEAVCAAIRAMGRRAWSLAADLTDGEQADSLMARAWGVAGPIHLLVNSAALFESGGLLATSPAQWERHLALNLTTPFRLMAALARGWAGCADAPPLAKVINIIDARTERPRPSHLAYGVSKSALLTLTRMAALELAPRILVNALAPGPILPAPDATPEAFARLAATTPVGRPGAPAELVAALLFLACQNYITGEMIRVDGGEHL